MWMWESNWRQRQFVSAVFSHKAHRCLLQQKTNVNLFAVEESGISRCTMRDVHVDNYKVRIVIIWGACVIIIYFIERRAWVWSGAWHVLRQHALHIGRNLREDALSKYLNKYLLLWLFFARSTNEEKAKQSKAKHGTVRLPRLLIWQKGGSVEFRFNTKI